MKWSAQRTKNVLSFLAFNLAGSCASAFGVQYFTAPHNIAPGGVAGLAVGPAHRYDDICLKHPAASPRMEACLS